MKPRIMGTKTKTAGEIPQETGQRHDRSRDRMGFTNCIRDAVANRQLTDLIIAENGENGRIKG